MPIISISELEAMDDQAIIARWDDAVSSARSAFLIMGKLTFIASQRMNGKALRQWKSSRNLSKGSEARANITSRFIELFVAAERITEQRFDSITWQVIEATKRLIAEWKKSPCEDTLNQLGSLISKEQDNKKLLEDLNQQHEPAEHTQQIHNKGNSISGELVTKEFLQQLKKNNPSAYPLVSGVSEYVMNHHEKLKAVGAELNVIARFSDENDA